MDVIDLAYEALEEIKLTEEYQFLIKFKDIVDENLKKLISDFNEAKKKYYEVREYGDYYPGIKDIKNNLVEKKEALYNHPLVVKYKSNENYINDLLNDLSSRVKKVLLPNIDTSKMEMLTWLKENH